MGALSAAYTVPELGRLMGWDRFRTRRFVAKSGIPVDRTFPKRPLVLLVHLRERCPDLWDSIVLRGAVDDLQAYNDLD